MGIYSKNRYEWFITDWACALFGITSVPLYDTLGVENLTFCLNQTLMTSIFVSNQTVKSLLKLQDLGKLKLVISYDPLDEETQSLLKARNIGYLQFWDMIKEGSGMKDVSDASVKIGMDDCYTFSYTSGTTGPPKGAMISHRNLLAATNTFLKHQDLGFNSADRYLSYLPLPHLMERSCTMVLFYVGAYVV
jgi:long-chain acyl-CoA synthetase